MKICLGSQSPARREVLEGAGYEVICLPSNVNESLATGNTTSELVTNITRLKTERVLTLLKEQKIAADILVCGDIVCVDKDGTVLGKPADRNEARQWFDDYSAHRLAGTVQCLEVVNLRTGERRTGCDSTTIHFKQDLERSDYEDFLDSTNAMAAAGCMLIEHPFFANAVSHIVGDIDSIRGLSLRLLQRLFFELGLHCTKE